MRVETDADGLRTTRHNYYFVSYSAFVNVVKYKLHLMRKRIGSDEHDALSRESFACPDCMKKFTDLEVDQLVDAATGRLCCTYCQTELIEHGHNQPEAGDSRSLMAKFHEQTEPIYELLKKVEHVRLSNQLLEPDILDYKPARSTTSRGVDGRASSSWTNESGKDVSGFGYSEKQVTVSMEPGGSGSWSSLANAVSKPVPLWLSQSTVDDSVDQSERRAAGSMMTSLPTDVTSRDPKGSVDKDDIMKTLLSHEKKSTSVVVGAAASSSDSDDEVDMRPGLSTTDYSGGGAVTINEEMDSDAESVDIMSQTVTIGTESVQFCDITDDMVAQMTPAEKTEYIRIGQELYGQIYE